MKLQTCAGTAAGTTCRSEERTWVMPRQRMSAQVVALAVVCSRSGRCALGYTVPVMVERTAYDLSCAKVTSLVREPDAGDRLVRFDEEDVETE